jgi:hypothetical protein
MTKYSGFAEFEADSKNLTGINPKYLVMELSGGILKRYRLEGTCIALVWVVNDMIIIQHSIKEGIKRRV